MVVYIHNISDAQSKDFTNILQSFYLQIGFQEDTERHKFILELWKMVIAPYWPHSCWFVAITSQKAWIIFLEQVLFTPCPPFIFLEQAGFYLGYHFTLRKINITMQIKQIVGKYLTQTACVVKEFGRKVTVESKPRWCVQWLSCFSTTILRFPSLYLTSADTFRVTWAMARYGTKGTMSKFFQPSVSQLETHIHLLRINCMINKSLLTIAGIWDYAELPICKMMILTILRCSYCFLSCLRSFDSLKSGISFQLKHKRTGVLHLLKWSTWKCKSLKTPRLVITGEKKPTHGKM